MEYHTYVFEISKKRLRENLIITLSGVGLILLLFFMVVIGLPGIGLVTVAGISISLVIFKLDYDKSMGTKKYGSRRETLSIGLESLVLKGVEIPYSELTNLVIYVDEYTGMPRQFLGSHHGGNNEITFIHKANKYSFNYLIRNQSEYHHMEYLVDFIERRYPPGPQ